jgi:hypothetical protein
MKRAAKIRTRKFGVFACSLLLITALVLPSAASASTEAGPDGVAAQISATQDTLNPGTAEQNAAAEEPTASANSPDPSTDPAAPQPTDPETSLETPGGGGHWIR